MFPIDYINTIPPDITMTIQLGAARAIYGAIVFAATALALTITYESLFDRGDGRTASEPPRHSPPKDRPVDRAA